jgi:hypothetical protein
MRLVFLGVSVLIFIYSCTTAPKEEYTEPVASNLSGKELAIIHCGSCHMFPEPTSLPRNIWVNKVLPNMGLRLGHGDYMAQMMKYSQEEMLAVMASGAFREKPVIAKLDWDKIVAYYTENSPDELPDVAAEKKNELQIFDAQVLPIKASEVVMTIFEPTLRQIKISTSNPNLLYTVDPSGSILDSLSTRSPVTNLIQDAKSGSIVLESGILDPSDLAKGKLLLNGKVKLDELHRPVSLLRTDLNNDLVQDFVICNFGNNVGNLMWVDGRNLEKHILLNQPGARVAYEVDFNKDNKKDLLVLFTQGKESIVLFENKGDHRFEPKTILEFPSYFGSTFFELKDIDQDGDLDIIFTNGDNADLSIIKKPFHGLRIYENDGKNQFSEKYFYRINGASKVISDDFDLDGDLDFAVISVFPIEVNEGFLFFENTGKYQYKVSSKKNVSDQKWLTMDVADFDNDGDKDIILGAFTRNENTNKPSVLILKNNLK